MGFLIKLSNLICKVVKNDNLAECAPEIFENDDWKEYCAGELDTSNKTNAKSLGGHTRAGNDDDNFEDEAPIDVNMEKIMARFNTYSQQMSQSSSMNDDDDEEVDEQNDDVDLIGYKEDVTDPFEHLESKDDPEDNSEPLRMEYLTPSLRPGTPIQRKIEV